jgi:hypothetical protein
MNRLIEAVYEPGGNDKAVRSAHAHGSYDALSDKEFEAVKRRYPNILMSCSCCAHKDGSGCKLRPANVVCNLEQETGYKGPCKNFLPKGDIRLNCELCRWDGKRRFPDTMQYVRHCFKQGIFDIQPNQCPYKGLTIREASDLDYAEKEEVQQTERGDTLTSVRSVAVNIHGLSAGAMPSADAVCREALEMLNRAQGPGYSERLVLYVKAEAREGVGYAARMYKWDSGWVNLSEWREIGVLSGAWGFSEFHYYDARGKYRSVKCADQIDMRTDRFIDRVKIAPTDSDDSICDQRLRTATCPHKPSLEEVVSAIRDELLKDLEARIKRLEARQC